MPYVLFEDGQVPDGMEVADVVPRGDYDELLSERDELIVARDGLADQLSVTQEDLRVSREKYAKAVLTSAQQVKAAQERDVMRDSGPQTFAQLFARREGM